jgi:hypothetical protein
MREMADYSSRISVLMEELRAKTLTEAERERNTTRLDYIGIGYGGNFKSHYPKNLKEAEKDAQTPELSRLEELIVAMGA